jgi:hypothetical protein
MGRLCRLPDTGAGLHSHRAWRASCGPRRSGRHPTFAQVVSPGLQGWQTASVEDRTSTDRRGDEATCRRGYGPPTADPRSSRADCGLEIFAVLRFACGDCSIASPVFAPISRTSLKKTAFGAGQTARLLEGLGNCPVSNRVYRPLAVAGYEACAWHSLSSMGACSRSDKGKVSVGILAGDHQPAQEGRPARRSNCWKRGSERSESS